MQATLAAPIALTTPGLRALALECGADDAGVVSLSRSELDDQRVHILEGLPGARTLVSLVCRMNRAPLRTPLRSLANMEFHEVGDRVNEVARRMVSALEARGVTALNGAMGFPMEMDRFPGRLWYVSHKPVAEAAGLGRMGIHRNLIHPRFGNFVLLATVVVAAELEEVEEQSRPIEFNPCLECKLCVAACPVGAIGAQGQFDFGACYTHNYREFMGGFTDWVETLADSGSARAYRGRVSDSESASVWQSLSFGANYKAAYCMAVCPAGEDVIAPFQADRGQYVSETLKPLQQRVEQVYVVPGSDAEAHLRRRFPHKQPRPVGNSLHPSSVEGFLGSLRLVFQRVKAAEVDLCLHFVFTGDEQREATIVIREGELEVHEGLVGRAKLRVRVDSRAWIAFLRGDRGLVSLLLTRKLRLRGDPRQLLGFGRCFL